MSQINFSDYMKKSIVVDTIVNGRKKKVKGLMYEHSEEFIFMSSGGVNFPIFKRDISGVELL